MHRKFWEMAESFGEKYVISNSVYIALTGDNRLKMSVGSYDNNGGTNGVKVTVISKVAGELDSVLLKFDDIDAEMGALQN